jgi:hypothetical protein
VFAELPVDESETMTIEQLFDKYPEASGSDTDYYWATLKSKYIKTIENLFSNPGEIDLQGWFLLSLTVLVFLTGLGLSFSFGRLAYKLIRHLQREPH